MALDDALDRYFDAWNAHDPDGVVAALTDDGTYEDPTTGGPLHGDALAANVAGLVEGFPDLRFEVVNVAVGKRNGTFSPWESVEAAEAALHRGAHAQAMQLAREGGIGQGARGLTSIWKPERLNNVVVPAQGGSFDLSELDGQWL